MKVLKYILIDVHGISEPIIFSERLKHSDVANRFPDAKVVSAGKVILDAEGTSQISVESGSLTLGISVSDDRTTKDKEILTRNIK